MKIHAFIANTPTPAPTNTSPKKPPPQGPKQRNTSGPRTKNGSYRQYYQRRHDGIHGDDRLSLLLDVCKRQSTSFTILDIGCNDGSLTTELASLDACSRAVGIDINPNLIGDARKNLRAIVENRRKGTAALQGPLPEVCHTLPFNVRQAVQLGREPRNRNGVLDNCMFEQGNAHTSFPGNVTFRTEDFALPEPTRTSREVANYDIVLCLSVTKWVHFAWGDTGLERMFRRIYQCLKPGGILVLEPQPMKSYKSAIRKGLGKKDFNGERRIKPHQFAGFLKSSIGFWDMKVLRDVRERGQAFNRPIMAFLKGSHFSWRHIFASPLPYSAFMNGHYDHGLPLVHNQNIPLFAAPEIIPPGNVPPADPDLDAALADAVPANPAPANPAPVNPAQPHVAPPNPFPANVAPVNAELPNATPANAALANPAPVNATPENAASANATSASAATSAAAPLPETQPADAEEIDGQNEQSEKDDGNDDRQTESPAVNQREESTHEISPRVNSEVLVSHLNETERPPSNEQAREGETSAPSDNDIGPRTSGCKRTRPDERAENDERRSKIPKQDTDEGTQ